MRKVLLIMVAIVMVLTLGASTVMAAQNQRTSSFVTGGGNIKGETTNPKGKTIEAVVWTFGGNVGVSDGGEIVGQFQIRNHLDKESCHCHNDFDSLEFSGDPIEGPPGPDANHSIATFTGTFTSNRGNMAFLTVVIADVHEPGKDNDIIVVSGDFEFSGEPISGGNFQMHKGVSEPTPGLPG